MAEQRHSGVGFWTGFLLGGAIGIAAGLLFAPKSGEETRSILGEKTSEWRDRAEELASSARDRVRTAVDEGRAVATRSPGEDASGAEFDEESFEEPL